jgi:hypothetical protein
MLGFGSADRRSGRIWRLLIGLQVSLLVFSLVAPIGTIAADPADPPPSPAPSEEPSAPPPDPSPSPEPSATPSAEPSAEATPVATPVATPDPVVDPSPAPTPEPTSAPTPTPEATSPYIVTFGAGVSAADQAAAIAAAGATSTDTIAALRMQAVAAGASAVAALNADPRVARVEPDRSRATEADPSDPGYTGQWALPKIGWDSVYGTTIAGSATVAILDTGVDGSEADLSGKLVGGTTLVGSAPTTDPNGHGTAMAGIVAAAADNGVGIAGVGYDGVAIMPVSVLGADGTGRDSDVIEGLVWATDHGADVALMAFSAPGYSAALQAAVDYAWSHGVVLVAATGNDGSSSAAFPAGDRGVVGVSNTDASDALDASSNYGDDTFLAAPGTGILTLAAGGGTTTITGTSASAAYVAGAAALLRAHDRSLSNGEVVGRLARTADAAGTAAETGNGRLNLARAFSDSSTGSVKPAGAAPVGSGGPFVGPYVAANIAGVSVSINGFASVNVGPGATLTATVQANTINNGGSTNAWNSTGWVLASTAPTANTKLANCVDTPNHGLGGPFSEPLTITAPTTPGTYTLYVELDADDGTGAAACGAGSNHVRDSSAAVVVFNVSATLNGAPTATVAAGASVTAAVTMTVNAPINNWQSTGWAIGTTEPAFQSQLANCVDTANVASGATATRSFAITAPTTPGTYSVYFAMDENDGTGSTACGAGSNNVRLTLVNALVVTAANNAPVVTAPSNQSSNEGSSTSFSLGSFADAGPSPWAVDIDWGDGSSHTTFSAAAAGSLGSQSHTYADGPATQTVTVKVTDANGTGLAGTATFQVSVNNVAPTTTYVSGPATVSESDVTTHTYVFSISDPGVDTIIGTGTTCGVGGTQDGATVSTNTSITFACKFPDGAADPDVQANATDSDNATGAFATFPVHVNNVAPVATNDSGTTDENTNLIVVPSGVLGNDTDVIGDPLTVTRVNGFATNVGTEITLASGAKLTVNANGAYTYKPNGAFESLDTTESTTDSFTYQAFDGDVLSNTATVTITITGVNDAPVAAATSASVGHRDAAGVDVTLSATDVDGDAVTFSIVGTPALGSLGTIGAVTCTGATPNSCSAVVHYTPNVAGDFVGTDSFSYRANDGDAPSNTATATLTLTNAAPTATVNLTPTSPTTNQTLTATVTPSDADGDAMTFTYVWKKGSTTVKTTPSTSSTTDTLDLSVAGNGDRGDVITVQVTPNDGHVSGAPASDSETVANSNPVVASITAVPNPVDEGSGTLVSVSASDADGDSIQYEFNCTSDVDATYEVGPQAGMSTTCTFDDGPDGHIVGVRVTDGHGGSATATSATIVVSNVAPTGTFSATTPVDEGSPSTLSWTSVTDPSSADTTAGFRYKFACTSILGDLDPVSYATGGTASTHPCTFDDNGPFGVEGAVIDKNNGSTVSGGSVTVQNVAPTADLGNDGPVDEGSPATISFSDQHDASTADTNAGFRYAYECNDGDLTGTTYATAGLSDSTTCTFDDGPGTYTVKARIIDKDDGFTEYTTEVAVDNVAPTADLGNDGPVDEASPATISFSSPLDPSAADTTAGFHYAFDCDGGALTATYATASGSDSTTCTFDDNGSYTVSGRIIDKDGGFTDYTTEVEVDNVPPTPVITGAPASSPEGTQIDLGSTVTDPSSADTNEGFTYAWSVTKNGSPFGAGGTSDTFSFTPDDNGTYVVTLKATDKDSGEGTTTATIAVTNVAPDDLDVNLTSTSIDENGSTSLSGTFTDPGSADTHTVTIDWGDGSIDTTISLGAGVLAFGPTSHQYLDDNPTVTSSDTYTITVSVEDDDGDSTSATTGITVKNVAPSSLTANLSDDDIDEGDSTTLSGTFTDPGTLDTHTVTIDWGDGSPNTVIPLAAGILAYSTSHTYADDNALDSYTISIGVSDDDSGSTSTTKGISVHNVAPELSAVGVTSASIDENGTATLEGTITDPGTNDTFTLTVDWGEGAPQVYPLSAGSTSFSVTHQYLDDNPTATASDVYSIGVSIEDDDLGSDTASSSVTVKNVAPVLSAVATAGPIDENGTSTLTGTITDPGTKDTFTLTVDWGEGSRVDYAIAAGATSFSVTHQYLDDNPTGTAFDVYSISVSITDDDTGSDTDSASQRVNNVAPASLTASASPASIDENASTTVSGSFTDPGTQDTHTVVITWGGGEGSTTLTLLAGVLTYSASHTYLDDNPTVTTSDSYSIGVTVTDDDTGSASKSTSVTVNNVAPSVTLTGPTTANEGDTKSYSYSWTDPGTLDTFTHGVSCGIHGIASADVFNAGTKTGSFDCTWSDDSGAGTATVTATVTDDDSGAGSGTKYVKVSNVNPAVTAAANQSTNEGASTSFALGSFIDVAADSPWSIDVDWGDGTSHTTFSATSSGALAAKSHTYADNTVPASTGYTVTVKVTDKDGGIGQATFKITVSNVAPTLTLPVFTFNPYTGAATASIQYSDPAWPDTHTAVFSWGDGTTNGPLTDLSEEHGQPDASGSFTATHGYAVGCVTSQPTVTVTDDDGGATTYTYTGAVDHYTVAFQAPIQDNVRNIVKQGNVIPVKLQITNCGGQPVLNKTLSIGYVQGDIYDDVDNGDLQVPDSVSSADTTGFMRYVDSKYMYNLATKSLKLNLPYTVVVRDSVANQYVDSFVIYAKK